MTRAKSVTVLIVLLLITYAVGAAGSFITVPNIPGWYAGLNKPSFNPPAWAFPVVWNILFAMMSVAAWLTVKAAGSVRGARRELTAWAVQLLLNFSWSVIFFGLKNPGAALIELVLFALAILATTTEFWRRSRVAGWLMVPYLAWVLFAGCINAAVWLLNSPST